MATVPRAPLIANPYKRVWISGVHGEGSRSSPATLTIKPPVRQRDWPVPVARTRAIQLLTWLNDNPNIFKNLFPQGKRADFSVPIVSRPYPIHLRTWLNQNPNLYKNTFPPGAVVGAIVGMDVQRTTRRASPDTLEWSNFNPSLTAPVAAMPQSEQTDFSVPPSRPYPNDTRSWDNSNPNLYTNPVPVQSPEFPVPATGPRDVGLQTWVSNNPNLYLVTPPASTDQIRPPLIARVQQRVWISSIHGAGVSSYTPYLPTAPIQPPLQNPEFPVPASRLVDVALRTWLNFNQNLYTNPVPVLPEVVPNPAARAVDVALRTWVHQNRNLYENPAPLKNAEFPITPEKPTDITLLTWISGNPNLYEEEVPPVEILFPRAPVISKPQGRVWIPAIHGSWVFSYAPYFPAAPVQPPLHNQEFPVPSSRPLDIELRTWTNSNSNLYTNATTPSPNPEFPVPPSRPVDIGLRTWVSFNSNLYTNTVPGPSANLPVPALRQRSIALLTWTNSNNGLYGNFLPINQTNWPVPEGRFHGPSQKTWTLPTNPNLFTPPLVIPSAEANKQFIGEIQSLGLGSIFDSSMGVT